MGLETSDVTHSGEGHRDTLHTGGGLARGKHNGEPNAGEAMGLETLGTTHSGEGHIDTLHTRGGLE